MANFLNVGNPAAVSAVQPRVTQTAGVAAASQFINPACILNPGISFRPPGIIGGGFGGGFGGGSTGGGPPAPTPTPTQPASATASATDLQILMAQIPTADDGDVIRSEHFNLMRAALFEIAGRLGVGPVQTTMTVSVVPALLPQQANPAWTLDQGSASGTGQNVRGWMEVELPDGSRIQEMKAFGKHTGVTNQFFAYLRRRKITDPAGVDELIKLQIPVGTNAATGESAQLKVPASTPDELDEFRKVDNRTYNYVLVAEANLAAAAGNTAADTASLNAVQIVCRNAA